MINLEQDTSIQFTDGNRVNLPLLKNQIDRTMLKITLLLQQMPTNQLQPQSITNQLNNEKAICQGKLVQTQTKEYAKENQIYSSMIVNKNNEVNQNASDKQEKRLILRDRKQIRLSEMNFMIKRSQNKSDQSDNEDKNESSIIDQQTFPSLQLSNLKFKHSSFSSTISPIKLQFQNKTDRSFKKQSTKRSSILIQIGRIPIIFDDCCKRRLEQQVNIQKLKRKKYVNPSIRSSILKIIQEQFKSIRLHQY